MRFADVAWGAFGFAKKARSNYIERYQSLVTDVQFLKRLETEPSLGDFQRLRDFLVHYGVPQAPRDLANKYMSIWPRLKPHIQKLAGTSLEVCNLNIEEDAIKGAYSCLQSPYCWGGDTVASKSLHFFNIFLFVMWDIKIQGVYRKGPKGYLEYLQEMQSHMKEIITDFKRLSLPGTPAEFLSAKLGYKGMRPLTKLIDDYNWMTITKDWPPIPPQDWLLEFLRSS